MGKNKMKVEKVDFRDVKETAKTATAVTIFFFPEKQVILTSRRINSRIMQISRRIIRTFCIAILHSTKLIIFRLSF